MLVKVGLRCELENLNNQYVFAAGAFAVSLLDVLVLPASPFWWNGLEYDSSTTVASADVSSCADSQGTRRPILVECFGSSSPGFHLRYDGFTGRPSSPSVCRIDQPLTSSGHYGQSEPSVRTTIEMALRHFGADVSQRIGSPMNTTVV